MTSQQTGYEALYSGRKTSSSKGGTTSHAKYQTNPLAYLKEMLKARWVWSAMEEVFLALRQPPFKVLVLTGHAIGKSWLAAAAINWWYDSFNPSAVISTAPNDRDVRGIIWKEVRLQRMVAGLAEDFIGASAPEMRSAPDHYAMGFTAKRGESFQGRHDARMLFVFDECIGVPNVYWETVSTMFKPGPHSWLCIGNPTDTTSEAYAASQSGNWRVFHLSSLDHPNIEAELVGKEVPVPAAVSVSMVNKWVEDWCDPVPEDNRQACDFQWPPRSGKWYRPGPIFQARVQGQWPDTSVTGVWNPSLWSVCAHAVYDFPVNELPEIGCDPALFGDDMTAIHARWGDTSVHHEEYNSQDEAYTVQKLISLTKQLTVECNRRRPKQAEPFKSTHLPIKLDVTAGWGGGVLSLLQLKGYNVIPIRAHSRANCPSEFPNRRSELWFTTVQRAKDRRLGLGLLSKECLKELQRQALTPTWRVVINGQQVEEKDDTKKKLKRSPDGMDALNLAYYRTPEFVAVGVEPDRAEDQERQADTDEPVAIESDPFDYERGDNSPWRSSRPDWFGRRGRPDWF